MKLKDLIALYRAQSLDADDQQPFCDDALLTQYANEAQDEACRRGQLLVRSSGELCNVAYEAGAETVAISNRIVQIMRAFAGTMPVGTMDVERMDDMHPGWQFESHQGQPTVLVTGLATDTLYFWPRPSEAGVLRLTVQHMPVKLMRLSSEEEGEDASDDDSPEIRPELHPALVDWMLYRAYSRDDTDLFNDAKARLALGRFEAEFGRKASGRNEQWMRQGGGMMPGPIA
jgi:hypothetical protein